MDYAQFAEQHNAAYAAFTAIYQQKNPPPEKPKASRENTVLKGLLLLLMVASMIVSGSRTVPEFGGANGDFVGLAAFFMLELGIIVYPFLRTTLYYDDAKHHSIKKLLSLGKWLAIVVSVAANLHHMFKTNGFHFDGVNEVMVTALSIGAPVLAFVAGDAFGALMVRDNHRQRKLDDEYKALNKLYQDELNGLWGRQQKAWGVQISVQKEIPVSDVHLSNGQSNGQKALPSLSTLGHKKVVNASELARAYFVRYPEALDIPARDLVDIIGAGKSTINNVQQEMRGRGINQ